MKYAVAALYIWTGIWAAQIEEGNFYRYNIDYNVGDTLFCVVAWPVVLPVLAIVENRK